MSVVCHAPGTRWVLVVGPSALVAVDPAVPPEVVDALWRLARDEAVTPERIVGAIPLGDGEDPSFAAVVGPLAAATAECSVTAVVRGSAVVDVHSVGGSRRFSAQGALPWLLAEFGSVVAVTVGSSDSPARGSAVRPDGALPLERAVARGDALVWSLSPLPAEPAPGGPPAPAPEPAVRDEDLDDAVVSGPRRTGVAAGAAEPGADESGADDDTVLLPRGRAARAAAPAPVDAGRSPCFGLRFPDGEIRDVREPVIVGRDPRGRGPADRDAALVAVPSPGRSVSGTHVRFEAAGSSIAVTDERSTNGTLVVPDGGDALRLRPGDSLALGGRARVELGDGIIIEIIPPDER